MPTLPTAPPATIVAGDTLAFTWTDSDYPASDGWTLTFALAGADVLEATGVADGGGWTVTLTAAETATLAAGNYRWALRVTKGAEAYTRARGVLAVDGDVINATAGEYEQWESGAIAALKAAIAGTATAEQRSYMIGDLQVVAMSLKQQLTALDRLERRRDARHGIAAGRPRAQLVVTSRHQGDPWVS